MTGTTVSVALLGGKPITIPLGKKVKTVNDAIKMAAEALGVNLNTDQVGIVKNGRQVGTDETIEPGDIVAAAPRVANGSH